MGEIEQVKAWLAKRKTKHIKKGSNAELCQACAYDPPPYETPYPWFCPGEPE